VVAVEPLAQMVELTLEVRAAVAAEELALLLELQTLVVVVEALVELLQETVALAW
jgi:hypothetical protein